MNDALRVAEVIRHGDSEHVTARTGSSLTAALKEVLARSPYPSPYRDDPAWVAALWAELLDKGTASRDGCRYSWEWIE